MQSESLLSNFAEAQPFFETKPQRTHTTTRYNPPADSQIQFFTSSSNRLIPDCFLCHHVHSCYNFKLRFVIESCNSATKVAKNPVPSKCFEKNFEGSKNFIFLMDDESDAN